MTLLAAFQVLLRALRRPGRHGRSASPVAGRTRAETERLIGFFVNTLVLRTDLRGDPTFRELLGRVREVAWGPTRTRTCPSRSWSRSCSPPRDLSRSPLFQVLFVLQNTPLEALRAPPAPTPAS